MNEFNKMIRKITDAIEDATRYAEDNENVKEYLDEAYGSMVDDMDDYKQHILKYIEEHYYNI